MRVLRLVVFSFFVCWCSAVKYTFFDRGQSVFWACLDVLNVYTFSGDLGTAYEPSCEPKGNRFASWVMCNFDHQSPKDLDHQLEEIIESCQSVKPAYNYTTDQLREINEKARKNAIVVDNTPSFNATANLTAPVIPPKDKVERFTRAYYSRAKSQSRTRLYGGAIFIYFAGCMLIGGIVTWSRKLCPKLVQRCVSPQINTFRRLFTIPPVNKRHTEIAKWKRIVFGVIPTRAATYVLLGYFALNVILSCVDYDIFPDNFYTTSKHQVATQTADLVQYRTGVISTIHTPVVFLLSGRNNLLLFLTGWPYETFLMYHKWLARGMWIHALIHSAAYTWLEIDDLALIWTYQYWYWGSIATIVGGLMLFQASAYFRINWYETFKTIHFLFSALYIAGLWYHLRIFSGQWMEYVYASIALWCADHFFRIVRLAWFGFFRKAECQLFEEDKTIKVRVSRPKYWKPFPGAFVYIYFMKPYGFWQSHPFTILSHADAEDNDIYIYIKVKGGVTKQLAKTLAASPDKKQMINVFVEGPYGFEAPLKEYSNALIVTGGNGVPTGYSNYDCLTRQIDETSTKTVKWIWIIKDAAPLKWFKDELLRLEDRQGEIDIYVTRLTELDFSSDEADSDKKILSNESSDESINVLKQFKKINVFFGRPDLAALVVSDIQNAKGSTAILSCGPGQMNDLLRDTVADNLNMSSYRVDYFEEAQVW